MKYTGSFLYILLLSEETGGNLREYQRSFIENQRIKSKSGTFFDSKGLISFYPPVFRSLTHMAFYKLQNSRASKTQHKKFRMLSPERSLGLTYSAVKKATTRTEVTCICRIISSLQTSSQNFGMKRNSKVWEESSMF